MAPRRELKLDVPLVEALEPVRGPLPTTPDPVIVLSVYVNVLAKGYGLSETVDEDPLARARAVLSDTAMAVVTHYLPEAAATNADALRTRLYTLLLEMSGDPQALKAVSRSGQLSDVELLKAAQIYWNLEGDEDRPMLPIRPGRIQIKGVAERAGIKVPNANLDFATMPWTSRTKYKGAHRSSGQAFRNLGARLAVLVADRVAADGPPDPPSLGGARLVWGSNGKSAAIVWSGAGLSRAQGADPVLASADAPRLNRMSGTRELQRVRVLVGRPQDVGQGYQRRGFDDEIDQLWDQDDERRVWLRGGPGLGKSYSARRVIQEALADLSDEREDLLIWVDSADCPSVVAAYSAAADRLRQHGILVAGTPDDPAELKARSLLEALVTSGWRWLVVLDNADAAGLIEAGLIPPGGNVNGRVLITTLDNDHRMFNDGRVVSAELFTPEESDAYLRGDVYTRGGEKTPLSAAPREETSALAKAVGYHPLALSIAAATITTNAMSVGDWVREFASSETMDAAADEPDKGGYPTTIGTTWRLALDKASSGLPDGVVRRAAMVAAVQDPDGHPTWLWDDEEVAAWVAGGSTLARRHGIPLAVHRLIDNGILELRGGTWKHGRLAMHQLAARAVRELAVPQELADLADALALGWLRNVAEAEAAASVVRSRNVERLAGLAGLSATTGHIVTALIGYSPSVDVELYRNRSDFFTDLAGRLARGGATGQGMIAHQFVVLGDVAREGGLVDEAGTNYVKAVHAYQEQLSVLADEDDEERAFALHGLGRVYDLLDKPRQSREAFRQSLASFDRLAGQDFRSLALDGLIAYAQIQRSLGELDGEDELFKHLVREVEEEVSKRGIFEDGRDLAVKGRWQRWAEELKGLGLLEQATKIQSLIVEASGGVVADLDSARKLMGLYAAADRWGEVEEILDRMVRSDVAEADDLVRLASAHLHTGRIDAAKEAATRAAEMYREQTGRSRESERFVRDTVADEALVSVFLKAASADAQSRRRWADAAELLEQLNEHAEVRGDREPGEREHEQSLAMVFALRALANFQEGLFEETVTSSASAVNACQLLVDLDPEDEYSRGILGNSLLLITNALIMLGRHDEAEGYFIRASDLFTAVPEMDPEDGSAQKSASTFVRGLGDVAAQLGHLDRAQAYYLGAVGAELALYALEPYSTVALRNLAHAEYKLGSICLKREHDESAETWLTSALNHYQQLIEIEPDDRDLQIELSVALTDLALVYVRLDRRAEAAHSAVRAVHILRTLAERYPDDHMIQLRLAGCSAVAGALYKFTDRLEDSIECMTRAANVALLLVDLAADALVRREAAGVASVALTSLADTLRSLGRVDEADIASARAQALAERPFDPGSEDDL